jgi:tetratricopeptide (TPR) repeat protein
MIKPFKGAIVMKKLMAQLKEDFKNRKITNTMIAKKFGVSPTSVGNWFRGKDRISFFHFLGLIEMLYGNEVSNTKFYERLDGFARLNTRNDNDRIMLEWFSQKGENKLQKVVIDRVKKDDYQPLLGCIYDTFLKRKIKQLIAEGFYFEVEELKSNYKPNYDEEAVMVMICNIYSNWELGGFRAINTLSDRALKLTESISEPYLRTAYRIRVLEMKMYSLLKQNKVGDVIRLGETILEEADSDRYPFIVNSAYITLAEAYETIDYKLSLEYIKKSMKLNNTLLENHRLRKEGLESTHDFIKILNNDFEGLFLTDPSERAHYFAKIGKSEKALEILNQLERLKPLTPFQLYYKAIALNDQQLLNKSFEEFIIQGDLFYSRLPKMLINGH